jgi:uncharacterized protein
LHSKFIAAALAVGILVIAVPASAHVTVAAPGVTVGASDASIEFRVPDESATASTVGLKVQLPTDTPLLGVLVAPMQGWDAKVIQTKLATPVNTDDGPVTQVVSEIDWTAAAGAGIRPGFFVQFTIIAGQLPDKVPTLTFKAIQTYSDGKVVSWIEVPAPGSTSQPEHPAPVLTLAAEPAAKPAAAAKSSNTVPTVLAVIALVLAAAALGVSVVNRAKGSKG